MKRLGFVCAMLLLAIPATSMAMTDTQSQGACDKAMDARQCAAWKQFWPSFQAAVIAADYSKPEPMEPHWTSADYAKWNAEQEREQNADKTTVASFVQFPFADAYRTKSSNTDGAPVAAEDTAHFLAMYPYIFPIQIVIAIKYNHYMCFSHHDEDGVETNCDMVHLFGMDNQIGLEFDRGEDGRYRLTQVPYVE